MIVDEKFNVAFSAMRRDRMEMEWSVSVRLFPDPASLKPAAELYNKENRQLRSIELSARGETPAGAFANALRAAADHVDECDNQQRRKT